MFEDSALDLLRKGTSVEYFDRVSEDTLRQHLQTLKASRGCIDTVEANVLIALNRIAKQSAPAARHSDQADTLTDETGDSRGDARKKTRRAELFDHHPEIAAALSDGRITSGHADLLTSVPAKHQDALGADIADLLQKASEESVDRFAEIVRRWKQLQTQKDGDDYHKTQKDQRSFSIRRDRHSGMVRINGQLDPESGAIAKTLLSKLEQQMLREDQAAAEADPNHISRTSSQRLADAFVETCLLARGADPDAARGLEPTLLVGINYNDLLSGLGDAEALGAGPISAETARRLACEGGIIPMVLGSAGQVLDMGRRTRLATKSQRTALLAQYGGCAVPECDAKFEWCHIHHIGHWETGGPTDLINLMPLCTRHHAQIHDGRLSVHRDESGADVWERPTQKDPPRHFRRRGSAEARPPRTRNAQDTCAHAQPGRQERLAV